MEYSLGSTTAKYIIALGKECRQLQKIVLEEDALQEEWLIEVMDSFPRLPGPLADILKSGKMTKRAAATINCMLKKTNNKQTWCSWGCSTNTFVTELFSN